MIEVRVKRLKLVDKMLCIQISEHNLAQKLDFFADSEISSFILMMSLL